MLGSRAVWHKGWKAVSVHPTIAGWSDFDQGRWELYHTEVLADPTRPQVVPPRERYVYPDAAEVPESAAANMRNRSFSIAVEVDVDSTDAAGVLFSHGAAFGGHALYMKDRKLKYVYNFVGSNVQTIVSEKEVPTGSVILGASFVREGDAMPTTGTVSLFVDDEKVGEGKIVTQPGNFSLVGEGLNIGQDPASPVTDDYPGERPFAFTGGTIKEAVVDVSDDQYVDLEREALAMMKRE